MRELIHKASSAVLASQLNFNSSTALKSGRSRQASSASEWTCFALAGPLCISREQKDYRLLTMLQLHTISLVWYSTGPGATIPCRVDRWSFKKPIARLNGT